MSKQFLRKAQVAARYQVHERSVDRMARDGRIPQPIYRGRFPLWDESKLEAFERETVIKINHAPAIAG
jgi:predicted DNA-binding transcriptional regulator AlpA